MEIDYEYLIFYIWKLKFKTEKTDIFNHVGILLTFV